jgi:rubrerythrin
MSPEHDSYTFYVQAADRASDKRGKALFLDLANQEKDHLHLLWIEYLALEEGKGWLPYEEVGSVGSNEVKPNTPARRLAPALPAPGAARHPPPRLS